MIWYDMVVLCYDRDECKEKVIGYSGAKFKKFKTKNEALAFMRVSSFLLCIDGFHESS